MILAGIDCGAKNTRTVIIENGAVIGRGTALTGFHQADAIRKSLQMALDEARIDRCGVTCIAGTGSGAKAISEADVNVNGIRAIAAAALYLLPSARTVIDVGAEESKVARIGPEGSVIDFTVNEKCAAGAGSFIESMARALEEPLDTIGQLALSSVNSVPMNAQCAIFAESEVIGLIHANTSKNDISKAIHDALASRVVSMIRRIGVNSDVIMLGGVACNVGFVEALRRELGLERLYVPEFPEYGAALGAAISAQGQTNS